MDQDTEMMKINYDYITKTNIFTNQNLEWHLLFFIFFFLIHEGKGLPAVSWTRILLL